MADLVVECGTPVNLSGSGTVSLVPGNIIGFYVNSTTSGTIVLRDGGSAGTVLDGTITPAIGFHRFPAACVTGCYATIGATLNVTVFFQAG